MSIYPNESSYIAELESKIKQLEKKAEFDSLTISSLIVVSEKDTIRISQYQKREQTYNRKLDQIMELVKKL